MIRKILTLVSMAALLLLGAISFTTVARSASPGSMAALGHGFTYQGELVDDGLPVDEVCDFQFSLWDDGGGGSQIGATQTSEDVAVIGGRFNVTVNDANQFGSNAFNGDPRWLEIGVRCPAGNGTYTTLNQRQPLSATPYAQFAARAAAAPWGGLVGIPAGFADGVDDDTTYSAGAGIDLVGTEINLSDSYRLPQSCSNEQVAAWDGSVWVCRDATEAGDQYANVIVVAKSGGDYSSVQDALDSIVDAAADNRYLVLVAPGVYTEAVTMKEYVDIEGAGEELVKITTDGSSSDSDATITGADNAGLRKLTVENTGDDTIAQAIYNSGVAPRLSELTILASDGVDTSYGIRNLDGAAPHISDVSVTATGSDKARAIYAIDSSVVTVKDADLTVGSCASSTCYTIYASSGSTVALEDVDVTSTGDGATHPIAIFANVDAIVTLQHVTATASNGDSSNTALYLIGASATVRDSILTGEDTATSSGYGISLSGSSGAYTVTVLRSEVYGDFITVKTDSAFTVNVADTLLSGGAVNTGGGGTLTCAGVYDESYTFYASTCP